MVLLADEDGNSANENNYSTVKPRKASRRGAKAQRVLLLDRIVALLEHAKNEVSYLDK